MSLTDVVRGKYLRELCILKSKHNFMATSTPIKNKTPQQLEIEYLSPVNRSSNASPNLPFIIRSNINKNIESKPVGKNKNIERCVATVIETNDKTCPANHSPGTSNSQESLPSDKVFVEPKTNENKQLILMDSDEEEEFWQKKRMNEKKNVSNRNNRATNSQRPSRKKNQIEKETKIINPAPTVRETRINDSESYRTKLPEMTVGSIRVVSTMGESLKEATLHVSSQARKNNKDIRTQSASKLKKKSPKNVSSKTSDIPELIRSLKRPVDIINKDDENMVRRSTRKKCTPLEFWNGERMDIDRDFTDGLRKNLSIKRVKKEKGTEIQSQGITHRSTPNSDSFHSSVTSPNNRSRTKKKRTSILKTRMGSRSKRNIRFSNIETGTTIDRPTSGKKTNSEWLKKFADMNMTKTPSPDSEGCIVLPGLNTALGTISSTVMQMHWKSINQSQAPELHHLIFCVMVGTVVVTIHKISETVEAFGHFVVPCGVSYRIENVRRKKAILSCFEVACNSTSK